jgi:hypothetical protein
MGFHIPREVKTHSCTILLGVNGFTFFRHHPAATTTLYNMFISFPTLYRMLLIPLEVGVEWVFSPFGMSLGLQCLPLLQYLFSCLRVCGRHQGPRYYPATAPHPCAVRLLYVSVHYTNLYTEYSTWVYSEN